MEFPVGCISPIPDRDQHESGEKDAAQRLAQYEEVATNSGPNLHEMLCLFFDVTKADLEVYLTLLDIPNATPLEVAETVEKDRSLINKRLATLCEADLAARQSRKRENGGFEYRYSGRPLTETVHWLNREIEVWSENMVGEI